MDLNLSEQEFTQNQKNTIYKEMLVPLKNKISQILLLDTSAAAKFLNEYNAIIANNEIKGSELLSQISHLQLALQEYEQTTGKEKITEEKGKILSTDIRDFSVKSVDMNNETYESEFLKFREGYDKEIVNQPYDSRDVLEQQFHAIQADLIMRKIEESKEDIDLTSIIKDEDKAGLGIWVRGKVIELKENSKYSEFSKKISDMILLKEDAVMIPELWKWMAAAEKGMNIAQIKNVEQESKALIPVEEKKIGFFGKMAKIFSSKPSLPLEKNDLKKIKIDWLAEQLPKEMLVEEELKRLDKEGKVAEEVYTPSAQYVLFQKLEKMFETGIKDNWSLLELENSVNIGFHIYQESPTYLSKWAYKHRGGESHSMVDVMVGDKKEQKRISGVRLVDVIEYADLLDQVCGSSFKKEVLKEVKSCYLDELGLVDSTRIKLYSSLEALSLGFENRKLDVWGKEEKRREAFYKNRPLKDKKEVDEVVKYEIPTIQKKEHTEEERSGEEDTLEL